MSPEDYKNKTEAIKNIVLSIAVVIVGVWSLFQFNAKLEAEKASAELNRIQNENLQRPLVSVELEKRIVVSTIKGGGWLIEILATLENKGNTDTILYLSDDSIRMAKVSFEHGKIAKYDEMVSTTHFSLPLSNQGQKLISTGTITMLAKQKKKIRFPFRVLKPGLYLVNFAATPGKEIENARNRVGAVVGNLVGADLLVYVNK